MVYHEKFCKLDEVYFENILEILDEKKSGLKYNECKEELFMNLSKTE
jgi:hypothetical protein